jgi:hypothetical protein
MAPFLKKDQGFAATRNRMRYQRLSDCQSDHGGPNYDSAFAGIILRFPGDGARE